MRTQKQLEQLANARASRWNNRQSAEQRFWNRVNKDDPSGCWLWTGGIDVGGYGVFWNGDKHMKAHRYSWMASNGPVKDGLCLDHLCRVRRCVNPAHLEEVNNRTNVIRGVSIVAQIAKSSSCLKGHELDAANCRISPKGFRLCRTCERERIAAYHLRHPEKKKELDEWRKRWKKGQAKK